jgi:hypothetical protein
MDWFQDYEHLRSHGEVPEGSRLRDEVEHRVGWEIFSEYGFQARIGRTLEKSGSSTAFLDPRVFANTNERLLEVLRTNWVNSGPSMQRRLAGSAWVSWCISKTREPSFIPTWGIM